MRHSDQWAHTLTAGTRLPGSHLDIQMDDAVFVHVFQPLTDLPHVIDHLRLRHLVILGSDPVEQLSSRQTKINR